MRLVVQVVAVVGSFLVVASAAGQTQGKPAQPKMTQDVYKNIQVLKDVPADQLIPAMQFVAASLGVECDFCHVPGAFEKDDKKNKQTARQMMTMMFNINKNDFQGNREVTCYTCHRGAHDPVSVPVIAETESMPAEAAAPASLPSAGQVLDKFIQAIGGAPALDKVSSRIERGKATVAGHQMSIDIFAKAPDKRISVMHTDQGDSLTAFDGQTGWLGNPGRPVREMNSGEADGARLDADLHFATDIHKIFNSLEVRGVEKIGDQDTYLVVGQREGRPPVRLYFNQKSALLLRMVRYYETPLGRNPAQIDYADYREVDGVKIPFRWTIARPSGRFTIQVDQVQQNVPVDDARFEKPAAK